MTITLAQALLLGFFCGFAKCCMPYTPGAFMYNTVIFNAVIVGAVMGNMQQAMMIGATIQLIYLGVIAAGGNQPSDPCLAAYIAIPIAIASNLNTNAAIALAVPVALLGVQISNLVYLWNGFFAEKADTKAADGDTSGIFTWGVIIPGIIRWGVFGVLVFLALYFGSGTMKQILNSIPSWLSNGLTAMGACLPAVGFAIIANLIGKKKYIPFFLAGFFLVQYSKIGTMPLLLIGLFLVFLYLTFTKNEYLRSVDEEDDDDEEEEDEPTEELAPSTQMLTNKDLLKAWTKWWVFAEVGHSFERMQAPMFASAMAGPLHKFYPKKEDKPKLIEALKRHMNFFNTEAHWGGGPILGLSLAMEEKKSQSYDAIPGETIVNLKTGLMGPLAGIGDTISWSTLMYLFIGLFLPLAKKGNPLGGIGPIVCLTVICFAIGYFLTKKCYTYGYSFAENMLRSGLVNVIIAGASILGLFMMGGLTSTYVTVATPLKIVTGTYSTSVQSIFDSILPGILPLILVSLLWKMLSKDRNYFKATILTTLVSLALGCLGIIV
ncbi:MAG: PTS system mannose/fructose/sorbose family transporter subunit IID [Absicoccus porci]|uniref:PTS system mannose/fructose/sorbose family transporter subunit IID n=1 Tax=Absicoccus porci TaxID=2486576 RepID=UPI002E798CEE|nr:PTS system mannose/fructose/sorbose family transporter subunit IID [Absicoccus porci]MEE1355582.1 PTS system mannose/fructose/sorbose family transporter subunit IID [Absicoccus porci]